MEGCTSVGFLLMGCGIGEVVGGEEAGAGGGAGGVDNASCGCLAGGGNASRNTGGVAVEIADVGFPGMAVALGAVEAGGFIDAVADVGAGEEDGCAHEF